MDQLWGLLFALVRFFHDSKFKEEEVVFDVIHQPIDTLSGLRQYLTTENLLKIMKNAFYFTLKALVILKILKFLS